MSITIFPKQILRIILGVLAFILPVVLPLGALLLSENQILYPSISSYYYTEMKWVFMIILILFGSTFILYGLASRDRWILITTGILTLLIAFFPTQSPESTGYTWISYLHIACAVTFFALLGWVIRYSFNLPLPFPLLSKIGVYIWIVQGVLILYFLTFKSPWPPLVFFLESAILWLFTLGIWIRNKISNKLAG